MPKKTAKKSTKKNVKKLRELEIVQFRVDDLVEYARNPRKNDHVVDKLAAIIKEFGFRVPIIAKSDGSIVDGHLRLKAAKKLKLETVPVALADDLTETQIKALRISINRVAELADWDDDLLQLELDELKDIDFDLDLIGFDDDKEVTKPPDDFYEKDELETNNICPKCGYEF